jgi:hypothetical protein
MKQSLQRCLTVETVTQRSAVMVAFPQAKRVHAVGRIAERMARAKTREQGEQVLAVAVRRQRVAMTRKGIATDRVDRECMRFESVVRARLWTIIFFPPNNVA